MSKTSDSKSSDVEALFFFLVFLTAVLIFGNRLEEHMRYAVRAAIAVVASVSVLVFVWRKLRA
jgi:hypothetical protein